MFHNGLIFHFVAVKHLKLNFYVYLFKSISSELWIIPQDRNTTFWRKMQLGPGKSHQECQRTRIPCCRSYCWHQLEVTATAVHYIFSQKYILHRIRQRLGFRFHDYSRRNKLKLQCMKICTIQKDKLTEWEW